MGRLTVDAGDRELRMTAQEVEIVSASSLGGERFMAEAPLGASIHRFRRDRRIKWRIFAENSAGLSTIFNQAIDADGPDLLLFVHDDVWIDDLFFVDRLIDALDAFDIVGIAGNKRRQPGQVKFFNAPDGGEKSDFPYLSGTLAHFRLNGQIVALGPTPAPCELLDGVFSRRKAVNAEASWRPL
jgi:protein O-GlcNAc transferase